MLIVEQRVHPQELYIQADNCWRENKNRWVMAFCSWLVMMGIFRRVTLSFLIQGHTHEDIDHQFSGIARKYNQTILWTLRDLLNLIPSAYPTEATRPLGIELPFIFDWKEFFNPFLLSLGGHVGPHVFIFHRNENKEVVMMYKDYHSSLDPLRGGDEGKGIIVLSAVPEGSPTSLLPTPLNAGEKAMVRDLYAMAGFPQEAKDIWDRLLNRAETIPVLPDDYFNFALYTLPDHAPMHAHVPGIPTGFEIVPGGQSRALASEVS